MISVLESLEKRQLLAAISNGLVGADAIIANVERGGVIDSVQYGDFGNVMTRYEAFLDLGPNRTVWGTQERVVPFSSALFDTQFTRNQNGDVVEFTHLRFGESRPIITTGNTAESYAYIWLDDANGNDRADDGYIRITARTVINPGDREVKTFYSFEAVGFDLSQAKFFQYQDASIGSANNDVLIVQGSIAQNSLVLQTVDLDEFVWVGQADNSQQNSGASLSGFAASDFDMLLDTIFNGGFQPAATGTIFNLGLGTFPGLGNGYGEANITTALAYQFDRRSDVQISTEIRLFAATDVPEMRVYGNGQLIPDGNTDRSDLDGTDFGRSWAVPVQQVFEIRNFGRTPLIFASDPPIQVVGPHADDFRVIRQANPRVAEGGSTYFTVQFIPSGAGTRTATIVIGSNDLSTTPYTFNVYGGTGNPVDPDVYEPDGDGQNLSHKYFDPEVTPRIARVVSTDGVWKMHSLHINDDVDWSMFELTEDTEVLIQTSSPTGDTRMYLYDSLGQQVGYDNDSGYGVNAALHLSLRKGVYYIRVDEYGNNATIPLYGLSVLARPNVQVADAPVFMDGAGRVFVYGTQSGDTISVDISAGAVRVVLNESQVFFPLAEVTSVFVNGRAGADTIYIGPGVKSPEVRGSMGSDTITIDSEYGAIVYGGEGNDVIFGGPGDDFINGKKGNDLIYGRGGNDYIQGGDGDDFIDGGAGDDVLVGYWGNDVIYGGEGNDTIVAGPADLPPGKTDDDLIYGGEGNDIINGGPGQDTVYAGPGNNILAATDGEVDTLHRNILTDVVVADPFDILHDEDEFVLG